MSLVRSLGWLWLWLGSLLALCSACTGTETGNPSAEGSLALSARSADPGVVTIGTDAGRVRVDAVWVSLGAIALSPCAGAPSEVLGPIVVDLLARNDARRFEREHDGYCSLSTRQAVTADAAAGAPPELTGRSLVVIGRRNDETVFRLGSAQTTTVTLSANDGAFAVDDAENSLILAFDLAAWFGSVDLSLATPEGDGTIRIDEHRNSELLSAFEGGVATSASLHHDQDQDGELDPDEEVAIAH